MKIAFAGKGGSGKSTTSALFTRYMNAVQKCNVLAIDADVNMNLSGLLGVDVAMDKLMANPDVADVIRNYIKGTNPRVTDISKFLPTTPPGEGSNLVRSVDDAALSPYSVRINDAPSLNLMSVGTYDKGGIGQTCYHSHLFVAENLLSHIALDNDNDWVVCDMVAGTDAFAYSMHLQFDAIVLIAEPTPESAEVCRLYMELARESGIDGLIHLVANKIEDESDIAFIVKATGMTPIAVLPHTSALKKLRQRGDAITTDFITGNVAVAMEKIMLAASKPALSAHDRMVMLHALHAKLNDKKWVQQGYGDVMSQIDPDFKITKVA